MRPPAAKLDQLSSSSLQPSFQAFKAGKPPDLVPQIRFDKADRHPASGTDRRSQQRIADRLARRRPRGRCRDARAPRPETRRCRRQSRGRCRPARRAARHNGGRSRSPPRRCRPSPLSRTSTRSPRRARSRRRSTTAGAAVGRTRRSAIMRVEARRGGAVPAPPCARSAWRSGDCCAKHRELAGIDARRAIFAGLVDPHHRCAVGLGGRRGASRSCARVPCSISQAIDRRAAERQDRVPAGHRNAEEGDHCTWSQRTSGAFMICVEQFGGASLRRPSRCRS